MLVATLWAAISVTAWTVPAIVSFSMPGLILLWYCFGLRLLGPVVTIASLFDETWIGFWLAIVAMSVYLILLVWMFATREVSLLT